MKQVIQALTGISLLLIFIMIFLAIQTRAARQTELDEAVDLAANEAVANLCETNKYQVVNEEEFIGSFSEILVNKITSGKDEKKDANLKLSVDILNSDTDNGLIAIRVNETFSYPILWKTGSLSTDRTVFFDRVPSSTVTLTYKLPNGETYAKYEVKKGDAFKKPEKNPGRTDDYWDIIFSPDPDSLEVGMGSGYFRGWWDEDENKVTTFPTAATEDRTFTAKFY